MSRKKTYPANLLSAVRFNEIFEADLDYKNLTDDQMKGLNYLLSRMTEREQIIVRNYFVDGMSRKAIGMKYAGMNENRVRQIIAHALKKMKGREWAAYVLDGYEARSVSLEKALIIEETRYLKNYKIVGKKHAYYQDLTVLNLPKRIITGLGRAGVTTVRDLIIWVSFEGWVDRTRNLGSVSAELIMTALYNRNFLPEQYKEISFETIIPKMDMEVGAFQNLNRYFK